MDGEDRMLRVFKQLGHEDPHASLNSLLEELYKEGAFLYVMEPKRLDEDRGAFRHLDGDPISFFLSRN